MMARMPIYVRRGFTAILVPLIPHPAHSGRMAKDQALKAEANARDVTQVSNIAFYSVFILQSLNKSFVV